MIPVSTEKRTTFSPPEKHHLNGVSLMMARDSMLARMVCSLHAKKSQILTTLSYLLWMKNVEMFGNNCHGSDEPVFLHILCPDTSLLT